MGIRTVAVYSDADAGALHVELADEAFRIGAAAAAESYLSIERIIAAAQRVAALRRSIPATGFCRKMPTSPRRSKRPGWSSSVRRRRRSAPWA